MGLLSLLPKEDQYFDLFTQMTLYISSAARELKEMGVSYLITNKPGFLRQALRGEPLRGEA